MSTQVAIRKALAIRSSLSRVSLRGREFLSLEDFDASHSRSGDLGLSAPAGNLVVVSVFTIPFASLWAPLIGEVEGV